ncbi:MAG: phosphoribosylamine--glycine ligase [Pyrinomonadaceae bacterium]
MNIFVIGSGGREHAICAAFARSVRVTKIFCAPGNAGIDEIAECVKIKPEQIPELARFARENSVDLTFVGGESPLALGIVDEFERYGLRIVGASKQAAELEASKSFAKDFMKRHGIPTARHSTADSVKEAIAILESGEFGDETKPVVVKADGLAAGKGVVVAKDRRDAISAIQDMQSLVGADAAASIVLEECLFGREVSLLMFADGKSFALMPPARDHKRIGDGDTGPNTGGMGTITDSALLTAEQSDDIVKLIVEPTLSGCAAEGFPFRGILFLGLMMTESGPMLLEYNVRFGDPETQSILVQLETDLLDICEAMLAGTLDERVIDWKDGSSATIVLASKGYPENPQKGDVIYGIDDLSKNKISIFHAGTAFSEPTALAGGLTRNSKTQDDERNPSRFITSGGRVLGVTATADTLERALAKAYSAVGSISFDGMQYRRDIGK